MVTAEIIELDARRPPEPIPPLDPEIAALLFGERPMLVVLDGREEDPDG